MAEINMNSEPDAMKEPVFREDQPLGTLLRKVYAFFASARLAMVLLVIILGSCVAGVTIYRGGRAHPMIFSTLWFNSILVLLVINVGFCFFGRIRKRTLTVVSAGMILFHLSFVAMLAGIIYNSMFYFHGDIRLTEGEILPSDDQNSYDAMAKGFFYNLASLRGETALIRLWPDYKVDGTNKKVAYEVEVGEKGSKKRGMVYITHSLSHRGYEYFRDKEGYSLLVIAYDRAGKELYGAYVPLQSYKQGEHTYQYATGTKESPDRFSFPQQGDVKPFFDLKITYHPVNTEERSGTVTFQVWPSTEYPPAQEPTESAMPDHSSLPADGTFDHSALSVKKKSAASGDLQERLGAMAAQKQKALAEGTVAVGEKFRAGDYYVSVMEVRYWAGMSVRHDPGNVILLTSLWVGLGGMIATTVGRVIRGQKE